MALRWTLGDAPDAESPRRTMLTVSTLSAGPFRVFFSDEDCDLLEAQLRERRRAASRPASWSAVDVDDINDDIQQRVPSSEGPP